MHPRDFQAFAQPLAALPSDTRDEESTRSLGGVLCRKPGKQTHQLVLTSPSGLFRVQQLLVLQNLRVPAVPSFSGSDGGVVLDRVIGAIGGLSWWATLSGRYRLQQWLSHRGESSARDTVRTLLDPDNAALGSHFRWAPTRRVALNAVAEVPSLSWFRSLLRPEGAKAPASGSAPRLPSLRVTLKRSGTRHVATASAVVNSDFLSHDGGTYEPLARHLSADWGTRCDARHRSLQYRLGISSSKEKASEPAVARLQAGIAWDTRATWKLQPRLKTRSRDAQAGDAKEGMQPEASSSPKRLALPPKDKPGRKGRSFSLFLAQPTLKVASSFGVFARAPICQGDSSRISASVHPMASLSACGQLGKFSRLLLDYTEVAARLDLGLTSSLCPPDKAGQTADEPVSGISSGSVSRLWQSLNPENSLSISLAQQLIGPVRLRSDVQLTWEQSAPMGIRGAKLSQLAYGADCMVPGMMGSARVGAWYSPTRNEAMAELRLF